MLKDRMDISCFKLSGLISSINNGIPLKSGKLLYGSKIYGAPLLILTENGIIIYSVGCSLSSPTKDFFKAIALVSGGRFIGLENAKILPDIIIGGALEEMALEKLNKDIETERQLVLEEASKSSQQLSDREV